MQKQIKFLKRLLAVVLSLAIVATTVIVAVVIPTAIAEGETTDADSHAVYPFYRDIDFSQYQIKYGTNSYYGNSSAAEPYWTSQEENGNAYIRYDTTAEGWKVGSWWEGNHVFVPSVTGSTSDIVLPTATTFRITFRIRTDNVPDAGLTPFVIYGEGLNSCNTATNTNDVSNHKVYSQKYTPSVTLAPSTTWTEFSFVFTTPNEYLTNESGATYDMCYIGFYPGSQIAYSYDIDNVTLAAVNTADTRVVDFADYDVNSTGLWGPSDGPGTSKTDTWGHILEDDTLLAGKYFNYSAWVEEGSKGLTNWYGHYNIPLAVNGKATVTEDMTDPSNVILPTNTTYRMTIRMRVNEVSGTTKLYRTFTTGQTTEGKQTEIATLGVTDGWTEYSTIFTTPEAYTVEYTYNEDGSVKNTLNYNRFYIAVSNSAAGNLKYDIDYVILEQIETVSITFDANDGSFGNATASTENVVVGDAPAPTAALSAPDKYSSLVGWSTTADGEVDVTEITSDMEGTTLYAVWTTDPHIGGYNPETTVITFADYTPSESNSYWMKDNTLYWSKNTETDATAEDGWYIRYESKNNESSWWLGNHAMAPSVDGTPTELPNGVTYQMTVRLRTQSIPATGIYPFIAFGDAIGRDFANAYKDVSCFTAFTDKTVYDTNKEWTEITIIFTTPDEYQTYSYSNGTTGLYSKFFFGFYDGAGGVNYSYDIDTITLQEVTNTNFYIDSDSDGTYELYSTVTGIPGTDLTLPSATEVKEIYNTDGTGYTQTYSFTNWYSDDACTESAVLKFGNFDVDLYCKPTVTSTTTDGQELYVGFDTYDEISAGMSFDSTKAQLSDSQAMSGETSMKATLSAGESTAFELKNAYALEAKNGKTYKVTLNYKSDAAVNIAVGLGDAGAVPATAYALASKDVDASGEWKTISLLLNADYNAENYIRGYAPAVIITAENGATVYVDNVTVSSVTEAVKAVKTDSGIRFMMSYNCGGDNTVVIDSAEYAIAEHGVLVTGADNTAAVTLESAGKSGVMQVSQTDLTKYYSRNSVTGATVYSVLLDGVNADDTYDFAAKGYVKLANGDVYYTDIITSSAAIAETITETVILSDLIEDESYIVYDETSGKYSFVGANDSNGDNWINSFFIHVPAGAVLTSANSFRVDLYADTLSWRDWDSGTSYTVPSTGYIRVAITGAGFDTISVQVPPESSDELYAGSRTDLYDTMYSADIDYVTEQLDKTSDSAVNYIFITDLHTGAYLTKVDGYWTGYEDAAAVELRHNRLKEQLTTTVNMANTDDSIDFIAIGGDIVNGYESPASPMYQAALAAGEVSNIREYVIWQIQDLLEPLKQSTKPVFILIGNHDDNSGQSQYYTDYYKQEGITGESTVKNAETLSDLDWKQGVMDEFINVSVIQDSSYAMSSGEKLSKYYYYDLEKNGKTNRVICLDLYDHRYAFNEETGEITDRTTDTSGMGYSPAQLRWLAEALKTAEGDVIMLSHTGIDSETSGGKNGDVLRALLAAYQNKTSYTNETFGIDVDFSSGSEGHITSYQAGHKHSEAVYYTADANIWQIISGTASVKGGNDTTVTSANFAWRKLTRAWRTEYEACFDVMSVTDKVVYKYNIGAGYDDKLLYPDLP